MASSSFFSTSRRCAASSPWRISPSALFASFSLSAPRSKSMQMMHIAQRYEKGAQVSNRRRV